MGDNSDHLGLVLSGGGARACYQVGVLSYIAKQCPDLNIPIITGVSAGSINAAQLASFRGNLAESTQFLRKEWEELTLDHVFKVDLWSLGVNGLRWFLNLSSAGASGAPTRQSIFNTEPLREFLSRSLSLEEVDLNIAEGKLRALALTAMSYTTGETVTFVHGERNAPTWERYMRLGVHERITVDHIMASAAIPIIFPAVRIRQDYFGDGSVRQTAPLAPAIHLGARRILVISLRFPRYYPRGNEAITEKAPPPVQVLGHIFDAIFLDNLEADAERLERTNRLLQMIPKDQDNPENLNPIRLMTIHPSRDLSEVAWKYQNKIPRAVRLLLKGLGIKKTRNNSLISFLMFVPEFTQAMIELGYRDAEERWPELAKFLGVSGEDE